MYQEQKTPADFITKPKPTSHFVGNKFWTNGPKLLEKTNESLDSEFNLEETLASLSNDKTTAKMEEELKKNVVRTKTVTINNFKVSSGLKTPKDDKLYWGLYNRRWYVCRIPSEKALPQELKKKSNNKDVVVEFLTDKTFSVIKRSNLEVFGDTQLDIERSKRDRKGYAAALATKPTTSTSTSNDSKKAKKIEPPENEEGIAGLIHKFRQFQRTSSSY